MTPRHTQFDAAIARAAEETLEGLTEVQRVHFALKLMLDVTSPDAVPALNWAAGRVGEHANIQMRESFERECG